LPWVILGCLNYESFLKGFLFMFSKICCKLFPLFPMVQRPRTWEEGETRAEQNQQRREEEAAIRQQSHWLTSGVILSYTWTCLLLALPRNNKREGWVSVCLSVWCVVADLPPWRQTSVNRVDVSNSASCTWPRYTSSSHCVSLSLCVCVCVCVCADMVHSVAYKPLWLSHGCQEFLTLSSDELRRCHVSHQGATSPLVIRTINASLRCES